MKGSAALAGAPAPKHSVRRRVRARSRDVSQVHPP
ncbi:hypothetical protein [Pseudarthrobacter sp. NamE2]